MRYVVLIAVAWGILSGPLASHAQAPKKLPRVGYLLPSSARPANEHFSEGLRALGYVEGDNIITQRRYAEGRAERYPDLAAELIRIKVDVIVADGEGATRAASQATATIPIVMVAGDPVASGLVASLRRPGRNVTGLSTHSPALVGKRLELLKGAFPRVSRVAVLANALSPASASFVKEAERRARPLGLQVQSFPVRDVKDFDQAFAAMTSQRAEALMVIEEPSLITSHLPRITEFATKRALPTIAGASTYADAGILMIYGPSFPAMFRRTAFYVDRILKGAKPAELPVEEPTTFEMIINLKTAKALALTIPPSVLRRADTLIQ